jgi:hypothetical protein
MAPAATEETQTTVMPPAEAPVTSNGNSTTKRHEEYQYLDLVQDILDNGEHRPDRSECIHSAAIMTATLTPS